MPRRIVILVLTALLFPGAGLAHGQEEQAAPQPARRSEQTAPGPGAQDQQSGPRPTEGVEAATPQPDASSQGTFDAPTWVALRSLVIPGWGQAKNGMWWKAILVAGIEGAMFERLYFEDRMVHEYRDKQREYPGQADFYERKEDRHKSHRRDFIWWTSLFVLLSMGDAFVDAHLQSFDVTLDGVPAPVEGADTHAQGLSIRLGVGWRW